ncbi:hypothetical protein LX32DRAFT_29079 [Colletotrichum zoysiae]|uniref:Uncharacterized protein n=1 Tax=Colletotrichum zoysiae TaxID=1216348 RepID=A0AAD9M1U0_9PEZI|nr:hypothetical protein LX32DRAFT_29079 [Colletotrichum zoysiae]
MCYGLSRANVRIIGNHSSQLLISAVFLYCFYCLQSIVSRYHVERGIIDRPLGRSLPWLNYKSATKTLAGNQLLTNKTYTCTHTIPRSEHHSPPQTGFDMDRDRQWAH